MRRALNLFLATLVVGAAFGLGFVITNSDDGSVSAAAPPLSTQPVRLVDEVRAELASSYFRWVPPAVLERPTVRQILEGLEDPHTNYLTAKQLSTLQERTHGTYSGIGLSVGPASRGLIVTTTFAGPARDAGIRKGDVIVRIDGQAAGEIRFEDALSLIKGERGTAVRLVVRRPGEGKIRFEVVRREVDVPPVSAHMVRVGEHKVAHIRVFSFASGSSQRIDRVTTRLVEKGAEAAIIDLRDNPGGLLSEAVAAASVYLEDGVVCRMAGFHQEPRTFRVTGTASHRELPLVVLVNSGSASAAEIVAAALYDNGRAALVGQRTFGKASVQTIASLSNGGALKLTTAKYVTPAGADITGRGIEPPVAAMDDPLTRRDEALRVARRSAVELLADG